MKSYLYSRSKYPEQSWSIAADDMVLLAIWYAKHHGQLKPCEDGTYHVWNSNMSQGLFHSCGVLDNEIKIMDNGVRELTNGQTWSIRVEGR